MARKPTQTVQLKVRMKEPLRRKLEVAAKKHGVSMNTEAVTRLDQSLKDEALLGGDRVLEACRLFADVVRLHRDATKEDIWADWNTFRTVVGAWKYLIRPTIGLAPEDRLRAVRKRFLSDTEKREDVAEIKKGQAVLKRLRAGNN